MTPPIINTIDMLDNDCIQKLLHSQGSLTLQLEKISNQPLRVHVLNEHYQLLSTTAKKSLKLPLHKPAIGWMRDVALYGTQNHPWVYATSIFPIDSLKGQGLRFKHLGTIPIGYVLFAHQKKLPYTRIIHNTSRETLYIWKNKPILIIESFVHNQPNN